MSSARARKCRQRLARSRRAPKEKTRKLLAQVARAGLSRAIITGSAPLQWPWPPAPTPVSKIKRTRKTLHYKLSSRELCRAGAQTIAALCARVRLQVRAPFSRHCAQVVCQILTQTLRAVPIICRTAVSRKTTTFAIVCRPQRPIESTPPPHVGSDWPLECRDKSRFFVQLINRATYLNIFFAHLMSTCEPSKWHLF